MDLVDIPENPVPSGAVSGMIGTADHRRIRFARWRPTARKSLGTVCIFTGRTEFIEKYFETVADLRRRGFSVAIMDWRGQGGSERPLRNRAKGHVDTFEEYEKDVEALMAEVVLPDCPPPYFALAHSMGGAILLSIATRPAGWFERIVLTSPMIRIRASNRFLSGVAEFFNLLGLGGASIPGGWGGAAVAGPFPGNPLTSDPVRFARTAAVLEAAPQLAIGAPTLAWYHAASAWSARLSDPDFAYSMRTPVLIVAAGADTVVSTPAIEKFALHMRGGKHLVIPGARHEVLIERDPIRELFWAAFDSFIPGQPAF